ncbi:MAG: mechanosensitive ion channel [Xanthomonadales bacterium]|nr:mechanosensitive ion channel [Xanthomonadales bacterium]
MPNGPLRRHGMSRSARLLVAGALALGAAGAAAQTGAGAGPAPPVEVAPVRVDAAPGAGLTGRLQALQQAIAVDVDLSSGQRGAFDVALASLLARSRALDESSARIAASRGKREQSIPTAVDVDATFDEWQARQPETDDAAGHWPRIARLAEEVRALRQGEQDLVSAAQADAGDGIDADPVLTEAVPVDTLLASLPDSPGHARAVAELARELEHRRIDVATALLTERRRSLVDRVRRIGAERAAITNRVELAQRKLRFLGQQLEQLVSAQLDSVRVAARRAATEIAPGAPAASIAGALPGLVDEVQRLMARGSTVVSAADRHDVRLIEVSQIWNDTRDRLAVEGASEALGLVLVSDLARTLPPGQIARQLAELRRELAGLRLRLIDLRSQVVATQDPLPGLAQRELLERARIDVPLDANTLVSLQFRMLVTVEAANLAVVESLARYEATLVELDRRNNALRDLIGKRLLWTPSHAPIGPAWFAEMGRRIASGRVFTTVREQAGKVLAPGFGGVAHPLWLLGGAVVFSILWAWLARHRRRVLARWNDTESWGWRRAITLVSLSVLLAMPWALLAALAFRLLRGGDEPSGFYESVVREAIPGFWSVLVLAGLVVLAGARGAAGHVLGWSAEQCRGLRRHALVLVALIVPSHIGVSAAWYRGDLAAIEYESRIVFILAWLGVALVFWHLLRPGGVWFGTDSGRSSLGRRLLRLGLAASALAAAATAALGLQITAAAIATEIEGTIGVLATLLVAYTLALHGIALGERRAAEWQAVSANLARKEGVPDPVELDPGSNAEELAAAGIESRQMVGFLVGVGGAIWLAAQWADLVPALWRLDEIVLWHATETRDGASVQSPVSLLDLFFALATAMLLVVGLRRLPGMADLLLRQRSSVDAGTRFAISAVLRYAIAVVGVVLTLGLLGVRWSNLQWMAAALTVGLGFGLQEIFANFVSGLILLFERPVRVGDVVTVGDVTGTVSNISTRATTVVDFDGREALIPNKSLITDPLVNWTLNSEVTRITIKVGVGFGSDPELAHRLLHQAAKDTPLVLQRPAPVSALTGFGSSNLDFELRVFVARIAHRVPASNALHQRILVLFAEAGIAIDYDQLDVRLVAAAAPPAAPGA